MKPEDVEKALERASDHDPHRHHTAMWPAIEALAEGSGYIVPAPMVTRTISVEVDARFPADGKFERTLAHRIHEVFGKEYMESGEDLHGYAGPFIHRLHTRVEDA